MVSTLNNPQSKLLAQWIAVLLIAASALLCPAIALADEPSDSGQLSVTDAALAIPSDDQESTDSEPETIAQDETDSLDPQESPDAGIDAKPADEDADDPDDDGGEAEGTDGDRENLPPAESAAIKDDNDEDETQEDRTEPAELKYDSKLDFSGSETANTKDDESDEGAKQSNPIDLIEPDALAAIESPGDAAALSKTEPTRPETTGHWQIAEQASDDEAEGERECVPEKSPSASANPRADQMPVMLGEASYIGASPESPTEPTPEPDAAETNARNRMAPDRHGLPPMPLALIEEASSRTATSLYDCGSHAVLTSQSEFHQNDGSKCVPPSRNGKLPLLRRDQIRCRSPSPFMCVIR